MAGRTPDRPLIIAVDGRSGSGKTRLATDLAALLREHHSVRLFHLEDLYPGWDGLQTGLDHYVRSVLRPLSEATEARWTPWDWDSGRAGTERTTSPAEIVLIEGVGSSCRQARRLLDASVWVDAPDTLRHSRALERDGQVYAPHWQRWADQEEAWLGRDDPRPRADILLRTDFPRHGGGETARNTLRALAALPRCAGRLARAWDSPARTTVQVEALDTCPDSTALFTALYGSTPTDEPPAVWLDSSDAAAAHPSAAAPADAAAGAAARGRFSIMADGGGRFGRHARHRAGETVVTAGAVTVRVPGPFFAWLDSTWLDSAWRTAVVDVPENFPCGFALGWLGYLGYELGRETGAGTGSPPDLRTPDCSTSAPGPPADADLLFAGRAVVLDHREQRTYLLTLKETGPDGRTAHAESTHPDPETGQWLEAARTAVADASRIPAAAAARGPAADVVPEPAAALVPLKPPVFAARDTRDQYLAKVRRAQSEIRDGNSYEVCLTTVLTAAVPERPDPLETYGLLRERNPAPFAHFMRFPGVQVASTSPERFLRISATGAMRAEPIKGTRPRSPDAAEDARLRADLQNSPKDRAENIMIVDLLRNDLSHHAQPGTVAVSRLCEIESYATVHQMVSTIDAQLAPGASRAAAVAAAFPPGSMTGAPKISTMAILERLEGAPRGIYSGVAGYFSLTGAADLAVVIRTLVIENDGGGSRLSLGVGGAVTADSDPAGEWEEVRVKAYGVLSALGTGFP
jgi:para-aminobenzoate synthetase